MTHRPMTASLFLQEKSDETERELRAYLTQWECVPQGLCDACAYSLFAGGKRLRPALVLGTTEMLHGDDHPALPAAAALEMIHTYSLIHDDLPAMDNDDMRRGKPTSHKVYGEATAILAGDTLLTMAFDIICRTDDIRVVRELAQAAGISGMAGGQFADLHAEGKSLSLTDLQQIHAKKTGALIRAAVRIGALLGGADPDRLAALTAYGESVGLAFQIADDILNVTGDASVLGKPVGSDAERGKLTYPAVVGLDSSRRMAEEAKDAAVTALRAFGPEADILRELAVYIIARDL